MGRINSKCDLISSLPDNLIENILVHLPLKEAVKTSTLSKIWRYNWITIPHLVFDDSTFSSSSERDQLTRSELLLIIHQVLSQHQGPISKFILSINQLGSCPEINLLISFLTRKSLKEFTLRFWQENPHKIPSHLFYCLQMRHLCLQSCVFEPPPDFSGFAELTKIKFTNVDLPARFAETFIANCPLLECLTLHECTNLDCINFYAPNLKLLDYRGCVFSVSFVNTPSLKEVSIEQQDFADLEFEEAWESNYKIETFCSLPSLEYLLIGSFFIAILGAGIVPKRLASNLNCLVVLVLSDIPLVGVLAAKCVLCLIKSSPNLQKLEIKNFGFEVYAGEEDDQPAKKQYSEAKDSSEISLGKLQAVRIYSFEGSTSEMEFIKLLLAKSPVLETMHIYHLEGRTAGHKYSVARKTNQLRRASPRAEVVFHEGMKVKWSSSRWPR